MPTVTIATHDDDENPDLTAQALALAVEMSRRKIAHISVRTDTGDAFTMTLKPARASASILNSLDWPL